MLLALIVHPFRKLPMIKEHAFNKIKMPVIQTKSLMLTDPANNVLPIPNLKIMEEPADQMIAAIDRSCSQMVLVKIAKFIQKHHLIRNLASLKHALEDKLSGKMVHVIIAQITRNLMRMANNVYLNNAVPGNNS